MEWLHRFTCIQMLHVMAGARLVAGVIDFEQRDEGMMVARGICDQLDDMKHEYAGLPDFLTRVGEAAAARTLACFDLDQRAGMNDMRTLRCVF